MAAVVVLPAPWSPTIIKMLMPWSTNAIFWSSPPNSLVISSLTILMNCCPGVSDFKTSSPMARSLTAFVNCLTTLKLTSASKSASLISRLAALMSASLSLPLRFKFEKMF